MRVFDYMIVVWVLALVPLAIIFGMIGAMFNQGLGYYFKVEVRRAFRDLRSFIRLMIK